MLHSLNNINNYKVIAADGEMGFCKDFLFNDEDWNLHYLLADTHKWLPGGKKLLIHTSAIQKVDTKNKEVRICLTKRELKDSPSLLANEPISRAYEKTYMCYFDYATYHVGPIPLDSYFTGVHTERVKIAAAPDEPDSEKNHIHSAHFVEDYTLDVANKLYGHIVDFVFDDVEWDIKFLAIELGNWFMHDKQRLLAPSELETIDWPKQQVHVDIDVDSLKESPVYNADTLPVKDLQQFLSA